MKNRENTAKLYSVVCSLIAVGLLAGCEKSAESFSILSDTSAFKQSEAYVQRQIDILWVIDNSGSMASSQANLANNFNSFINRFSRLNYDFRMGVTTTDAYLAYHYHNDNRSKLRDGAGSNHSGVFIIDKDTPNMTQTFITNITQGIGGNGDERAFSSMEHTLSNDLNKNFRRDGAFLAIIIVSDEDDFSHYDWQNGTSSYVFTENYNNSTMFPISHFTDYLNGLTHSDASTGIQNYSVSTISIMDSACLAQLNGNSQKVSQRYQLLADATGGTKGSLCDDFGNTLQMISDKVIELSTVFQLSREPYEQSIVVTVDGTAVPRDATNGWTYDAAALAISFHGTAVPAAGSDVRIGFDPINVKL